MTQDGDKSGKALGGEALPILVSGRRRIAVCDWYWPDIQHQYRLTVCVGLHNRSVSPGD
jgi:hypothetical protein